MKKSVTCLLAIAVAGIGLTIAPNHSPARAVSPAGYYADGGGPTPPPIPMSSIKTQSLLLADGGGPTPPPIPMRSHFTTSERVLVADGGGPTPPPIPMTSHATVVGPVFVVDGGGPTPPPIPMNVVV